MLFIIAIMSFLCFFFRPNGHVAALRDQNAFTTKEQRPFLSGNWGGHRECHISPDWLLIYKVNEDEKLIEYVRTGSHSELFS
ncbi:MAG: type II toxin-antitoxin system YafQ family toxin [Deltaproteobacteria bacterium]|nr:type II toxin-antitoxin system YafQ family toxin [Deltaproteobacteria bacterium]